MSLLFSLLCFFFFFFQAEDGIRDLTVTGVQTCALPISQFARQARASALELRDREFTHAARALGASHGRILLGTILPNSRSEERRVGKECRSRWSPYH